MGQLQRLILVILACVICISPGIVRYRQHSYFMTTLTEAYVSCFFEELCEKRELEEESYRNFCEKVRILCNGAEVYVEEYRSGFRQDGTEYRIYIPWYEIAAAMQKEGVYNYNKGSELRLHVGNRTYYGLVR